MRNKHAQITLFVLLGLLILLIIIILIVIRNANKDDTQFQGIDTQTLEAYITSCIDNVGKNALTTLGLQGGIFDASQSFSETIELDGVPTPIAYGLKNDNGFPIRPPKTKEEFQAAAVLYNEELEDPYPWPSWPLSLMASPTQLPGLTPNSYAQNQYDGILGQFSLPKLCNPNNPVYCGAEDFYAQTFDERKSIVALLSQHTALLLSACLEEDTLSTLLERKVTIDLPNVTITLANDGTIFDVVVDLIATSEQSVIRTQKITHKVPIPLLSTYRFAYQTLKQESKDPYFLINQNHEGFTVTKQKLLPQQVESNRDDLWLITIENWQSQLDWDFRFLIENRPPIVYIDMLATAGTIENGEEANPQFSVIYESVDPDEEQPELTVDVRTRAGERIDNTPQISISQLQYGEFFVDVSALPQVFHPRGNYIFTLTATDAQGTTDWQRFSFNHP